MSNYIEYNDTIAFHPGYYIQEIVEESGLTQADFAKRLDTTPKNLSLLIRGDQSLSNDIAMKLSRMLGTSVQYWLNLQSAYDSLIAEFKSQDELVQEREIFKYLDYKYFRDNFGLPDLPRMKDEQIKQVRELLKVSTLSVLQNKDLAVSFRSSKKDLSEACIVKANVMVQLATNHALEIEAPKYDKKKFEEAIKIALTLTKKHSEFYPIIKDTFKEAGVLLVALPNISGSQISGATKKIGNNIMLLVNDRRMYADSFWFTLFHEIGHIINSDYGISFDKKNGDKESDADRYAANMLISEKSYNEFIRRKKYTVQDVLDFADEIDRDPGIVIGRLQNDGLVDYDDYKMQALRHKYKVCIKKD